MGEFNVNKTTGGLDSTAGMPETYPASQVIMSDGTTSVEDALDGLTAYNTSISTRVDISSYSDSDPYLCPVDGIVLLGAGATGRYGNVKINGAKMMEVIQGYPASLSQFVKKGMSISCSVSGGAGVFFYPLS